MEDGGDGNATSNPFQDVDINMKGGEDRNTCLHLASGNSINEITRRMLPALRNNPSRAMMETLKDQVSSRAHIANTLLRYGADANARNKNKCTPLHLAATNGDLPHIIRIFNMLGLDKGERSGECLEELVLYAQIDTTRRIIKLLVAKGADINARDRNLQTPLHIASSSCRHWDIAKELLSHGANVHAEDSDGCTPLHLAMKYGSVNVIKALLECGADANAVNHQGQTPLHVRAGMSTPQDVSIEFSDMLFCINPENYHGKLHLELRSVSSIMIDKLMAHGANLNVADHTGQTPLHAAQAWHVHSGITKILCERGAEVNVVDHQGQTPLHLAVTEFHESTNNIKILLEYGANLNAKNVYGVAPIHYAVAIQNKSKVEGVEDFFNVLTEHGADLECRNRNGETLAHLLCLHLVETFAEMEIGLKLDMMIHLFSHGADVNAKDPNGNTPHTIIMRLRDVTVTKKWKLVRAVVNHQMNKMIALGAARIAKKNRSLYLEVMASLTVKSWDRAKLRPLMRSIKREEHGSDYYEQCVAEVEKMKATRIAGDVTLADLLTFGDPATLARFSGNVDFREHAIEHSKFPMYLFLIKSRYEKSLEMKLLCDNCETALGVISSGKMSRDCNYMILKYLSEVELKNLSEIGINA